MNNLIPFDLFESINEDTQHKKLALYHGVRNKDHVQDILKNGFDLKKINPIWTNDYAISTMTTPAAVRKFFAKDVDIIKIEFDGVIGSPEDACITAKTARDYTKQLVADGIDAIMLDGSGARQVFIYNTDAIKRVTLL